MLSIYYTKISFLILSLYKTFCRIPDRFCKISRQRKDFTDVKSRISRDTKSSEIIFHVLSPIFQETRQIFWKIRQMFQEILQIFQEIRQIFQKIRQNSFIILGPGVLTDLCARTSHRLQSPE